MYRFLIVVLLVISQSIHADDFTAGTLRKNCNSAVQMLDTGKGNAFDSGNCLGYLWGLVDGRTGIQQAIVKNKYRVCMPTDKKVTGEQLVRVYVNYADKYPQKWGESRLLIALEALHSAWPCGQSQVYDPQVFKAQIFLEALGYNPGVRDGLLGKKTIEAIKAYQEHQFIPVDGKVDDTLINHLSEAWERQNR